MTEPNNNQNLHLKHFKELKDLIAAAVMPKIANEGGVPILTVPNDWSLQSLEPFLPNPVRMRRHVTLHTMQSFIEYAKAHRTESTALFADESVMTLKAVFDYCDTSKRDGAGWGDHAATFVCIQTNEWKTWMERNERLMSQSDFAQFLEDNLPDIVAPDGATMLEIAKNIEAKRKVDFSSAVRLENGDVQFKYQEHTEGTAQTASKGVIEIPSEFVIAIPPFRGSLRYRIKARLRWRIKDGGELQLWYHLDRPHKDLEDAFNRVMEDVQASLDMNAYAGAA